MNILVAEDDRDIADLIAHYVERSGWTPHTVGSGDDALAQARKQPFDLVILDGEATPTGGLGIAKQLKDEIADCPPVLVLTGRPDDAWLASWSRAEAAVPHPIDPIRLGDAVVSLLRTPVQ